MWCYACSWDVRDDLTLNSVAQIHTSVTLLKPKSFLMLPVFSGFLYSFSFLYLAVLLSRSSSRVRIASTIIVSACLFTLRLSLWKPANALCFVSGVLQRKIARIKKVRERKGQNCSGRDRARATGTYFWINCCAFAAHAPPTTPQTVNGYD